MIGYLRARSGGGVTLDNGTWCVEDHGCRSVSLPSFNPPSPSTGEELPSASLRPHTRPSKTHKRPGQRFRTHPGESRPMVPRIRPSGEAFFPTFPSGGM